jgi:hypothetical protein
MIANAYYIQFLLLCSFDNPFRRHSKIGAWGQACMNVEICSIAP